jgi:GNAT superfamily N-acetyltransferase|tara:strand:+ start:562 stop:1017 length:456 start_codon:yes stop_codon:yes gene_type:complete
MISAAMTIVPFSARMQREAEKLVVDGLVERWGFNDPEKNPDLRDISDAYRGGEFFVGLLDGRIVATGAVVQESHSVARIMRMSVVRELRGEGLGKAMLTHLEQVARSRGCHTSVLETTADWSDAINFYRSQGYAVEGYANGDAHFRKALES